MRASPCGPFAASSTRSKPKAPKPEPVAPELVVPEPAAPEPVAPAPEPVAPEPVAPVPTSVAPEPEPEPAEDDLAGGLRATGSPGVADRSADAGSDAEGARLIALNMALNGTPREETDRYLSENFSLADRAGLLDEVYSSVQG